MGLKQSLIVMTAGYLNNYMLIKGFVDTLTEPFCFRDLFQSGHTFRKNMGYHYE